MPTNSCALYRGDLWSAHEFGSDLGGGHEFGIWFRKVPPKVIIFISPKVIISDGSGGTTKERASRAGRAAAGPIPANFGLKV